MDDISMFVLTLLVGVLCGMLIILAILGATIDPECVVVNLQEYLSMKNIVKSKLETTAQRILLGWLENQLETGLEVTVTIKKQEEKKEEDG